MRRLRPLRTLTPATLIFVGWALVSCGRKPDTTGSEPAVHSAARASSATSGSGSVAVSASATTSAIPSSHTVAGSGSASGKPSTPALFRASFSEPTRGAPASSATAQLHLLGSIHVAKPSMYPIHPDVMAAFDKSTSLVVEIHMDDAAKSKATELVAKSAYVPPDDLEKHLSKATYKLLDDSDDRPMPMFLLKRMPPWVVSVLMIGETVKKLGLDPELGIDKHFTKRAEDRGMKIVALETVEAQLGVFSGLAASLQEAMLLETLEESALMKKQLDAMTDAWSVGDLSDLEKMLAEAYKKPEFRPLQKKLFTDRNVLMAKAIVAMLRKGESPFVVVGAGHMVGADGIVELLKKAGATTERVSVPTR